jgi:large subunit ribosomal protein L24
MKTVKKGTIRSKIKRGDQVVFIAGKEFNRFDSSGKRTPYRGKVISVDPRSGKVKVEGAMIVKRHRKAVPQMNVEGGIFEQEAWVNASNIAHIDPETGKPTRVRYEVKDGVKVRVAKSGKSIPEPAVPRKTKAAPEDGQKSAPEEVSETEKQD